MTGVITVARSLHGKPVTFFFLKMGCDRNRSKKSNRRRKRGVTDEDRKRLDSYGTRLPENRRNIRVTKSKSLKQPAGGRSRSVRAVLKAVALKVRDTLCIGGIAQHLSPIFRSLRPTWRVCEAHLHQAYKPGVIRALLLDNEQQNMVYKHDAYDRKRQLLWNFVAYNNIVMQCIAN